MGLMLYNMGAGILRAVGDSKRPFYFLVAAAVLNIGLDLLLVIVFHMGVEGVAYATIISQGVSALLTLLLLVRTSSCVKLDWPGPAGYPLHFEADCPRRHPRCSADGP